MPATVSMLLLCATATASGATQFEAPANREAAEILPAELLRGPKYQVRDTVVSYGYMHHWTVDSDFGTFEATGDGALRSLIREIHAIAALKEISQSEAFADSIAYAAKQPVQFAGKMIADPVDTISAVPSGVFQIFGNVYTAVTEKHDPSEDSRLKQALFVSSWKRDFAAEYGVNVYSSNKVLQEQLNKVGWASAVGGLSLSAAMMPMGGAGALVFKNTRLANQVSEALKEEPPSRLRIINNDKLSAMGVPKDLAERFLDHPSFTPRHDTIIVAALADLKNPRGRDTFLQAILSAQDEASADFFMNISQTLQGYNETISPIEDISLVNGLTIARAKSGRALIPFALDHGVWSERGSGVISHMKQTYEAGGFRGKYDLWVTGTVTPRARQELAGMGIQVTENVDEKIGFLD
ncbi:MAG: hypothetical protein O7I42_08785 [Alphaproteobacteria bacterium]|nr:hypothetical protein [Alphaproteobacteria bacterium]